MPAQPKAVPPIAIIRDKKLLEQAEHLTYKRTSQGDLTLHCFYPEGHDKSNHRTAVILFHGGLWDQPMETQFAPQALNFVALGAVGIIAEYRTSTKHHSTPIDSVSDAQSAILWLRKNNRYLGIDPDKIIAGGSASGAHIALCAAMHKKVANDGFHSATPNALILWSAIIDTTKRGVGLSHFPHKRDATRTSPSKHIRRKLPPMIFFHGNEDPTVPVASVEKFCQRLRSKRNIARFVPFNRATHSFFNFNVNQQHFVQTLEAAEGFLIDQGFLSPSPDHIID